MSALGSLPNQVLSCFVNTHIFACPANKIILCAPLQQLHSASQAPLQKQGLALHACDTI